ncbi:MAG: hypothetical protein LUF90_08975 [Rikenellaceae bacterium]|nr:hypothetical protein [Rikenellaceae bacterium]
MENNDLILVKRETLSKLIQMNQQLVPMVIILSIILEIEQVNVNVPVKTLMKLIYLDPEKLEDYVKNNLLVNRSITADKVYSLYDLALLPERICRKERRKRLHEIPLLTTRA